jgi:hypothetical protein
MLAAFYLLTLAGLVGSYDVLYYHIYKLKLYKKHDAMWENVTHAIRALLFAAMMLTVMHLRCSGWWWLIYPILLSFELINTMTDAILEPKTRKSMGGLPPVEYYLHIFLSIVTGAALASIIWGTYSMLWEAPSISLRMIEGVPLLALPGAYFSVVVSIGMFVWELAGVRRLYRERRENAAHQPEAQAREMSRIP